MIIHLKRYTSISKNYFKNEYRIHIPKFLVLISQQAPKQPERIELNRWVILHLSLFTQWWQCSVVLAGKTGWPPTWSVIPQLNQIITRTRTKYKFQNFFHSDQTIQSDLRELSWTGEWCYICLSPFITITQSESWYSCCIQRVSVQDIDNTSAEIYLLFWQIKLLQEWERNPNSKIPSLTQISDWWQYKATSENSNTEQVSDATSVYRHL